MDQWLIRTVKNVIAGPYSKDQIRQLIQSGQLSLQDEICQANQYWISLYETDEVMRQLGIEIPRSMIGEEDITETSTETLTHPSDIHRVGSWNKSSDDDTIEIVNEDVPELGASADELTEDTAIITNRALREFQPKKKAPAPQAQKAPEPAMAQDTPAASAPVASAPAPAAAESPAPSASGTLPGTTHPLSIYKKSNASLYRPVIFGKIEKASVWRSLVWALMLISLFLVVAVIVLLKVK